MVAYLGDPAVLSSSQLTLTTARFPLAHSPRLLLMPQGQGSGVRLPGMGQVCLLVRTFLDRNKVHSLDSCTLFLICVLIFSLLPQGLHGFHSHHPGPLSVSQVELGFKTQKRLRSWSGYLVLMKHHPTAAAARGWDQSDLAGEPRRARFSQPRPCAT